METKRKTRVLCALTSFCVAFGTLASAVPVMADDPNEEMIRAYQQRQEAYQKYAEDQSNAYAQMQAQQQEAMQAYADQNRAIEEAQIDAYRQQQEKYQEYIDEQNRKAEELYRDRGWWYGHDWSWRWEPKYIPARYHNNVSLDYGDTYRIAAYGVIHYWSTDSNIASVDGNGVITAHNDGRCTVYARFADGSIYAVIDVNVRKPEKKNDNVVYTPVYTPVSNPVANTASWLAIATNLVVSTPKNGTVNLSSPAPLYFDANFANVLKLRPDVTVNVTYGYNGHTFLLTIPKGYNLAGRLNAAGAVDFVSLSNVVDGKIRCKLLY